MVDNVITDLEPLIKSTVPQPEVVVDIGNAKEIITDRNLCFKVLSVLLFNAVIYGEQPTKVTVTGTSTDDGYRLTVKDTGWGIPTDEQSKIFNYAYRGEKAQKSDYSGLGVELYIARKLVRLIHAELLCLSREGEGSQFSILFKEQ
jgi:K+-sensing histidine kinase KdpD